MIHVTQNEPPETPIECRLLVDFHIQALSWNIERKEDPETHIEITVRLTELVNVKISDYSGV